MILLKNPFGHLPLDPLNCAGPDTIFAGDLQDTLVTPGQRGADVLLCLPVDRLIDSSGIRAHNHLGLPEATVWQAFRGGAAASGAVAGRFDGFHATTASVSRTCLVRFDTNKYSVASRAVGRPVEIQAYADRIVICQDGPVVAEHARRFGRGQTIYDPWPMSRCWREAGCLAQQRTVQALVAAGQHRAGSAPAQGLRRR